MIPWFCENLFACVAYVFGSENSPLGIGSPCFFFPFTARRENLDSVLPDRLFQTEPPILPFIPHCTTACRITDSPCPSDISWTSLPARVGIIIMREQCCAKTFEVQEKHQCSAHPLPAHPFWVPVNVFFPIFRKPLLNICFIESTRKNEKNFQCCLVSSFSAVNDTVPNYWRVIEKKHQLALGNNWAMV